VREGLTMCPNHPEPPAETQARIVDRMMSETAPVWWVIAVASGLLIGLVAYITTHPQEFAK
jgi:hypothetical protein